MSTRKRIDIQELNEYFMGRNGSRLETGITAVTGNFWALHCLTDTVFSLYTAPDLHASSDSHVGVTFLAGTVLYDRVTAFTLTSGAVKAYLLETEHSL